MSLSWLYLVRVGCTAAIANLRVCIGDEDNGSWRGKATNANPDFCFLPFDLFILLPAAATHVVSFVTSLSPVTAYMFYV